MLAWRKTNSKNSSRDLNAERAVIQNFHLTQIAFGSENVRLNA